MCGITQTTHRSGWSLPKVLQLFSGNFVITRFGHTISKACHFIFGHYIINECCDIICDVTVPHVPWSCDHLL